MSANFGRNNYKTDDKLFKTFDAIMANLIHRKSKYFSILTAVIH